MCELLGINSTEKIVCNHLLREFFSHSTQHPDGWGLATFYENAVSLEKEPVSALDSIYLKNRLTDEIREDVLLAHIRKASVGKLSYQNSHPFALRDCQGRLWTFIHNGTIFESPALEPYKIQQKGETDSERILYYLVDQINFRQANAQKALSDQERFAVVDDMIHAITPKNKVNLLIYDGELFYIHANHKGSLYLCQNQKTETTFTTLIVSTQPLNIEQSGNSCWTEVPQNTLLAYRKGRLIYQGKPHHNEYIKLEDTEKSPD